MVNIILGNKGGIAKSTISALISEYKIDQDKEVFCIDLDAENTSFLKFKSLNVMTLQIKDKTTGDINKKKLDELFDIIFENKNKEIIIDTGSTLYTPLTTYFIENNFFQLLEDEGIKHNIISIVAGGGNFLDSLKGLQRIGETFPKTDIILINNQLLGSTIYNDIELINTKVVDALRDRITGIVNISKKSDYITEDIVNMRQKSLLFSDLKTSDFGMMQRRRLIIYRDEIWAEFEKAGL